LWRLEDFLIATDKRYTFDHASLAHWLTGENDKGQPRAGRFAVDRVRVDQRFAEWARRAVVDGRAHESEYLARHLTAHLGAAERKTVLPKLLVDLRWLNSRLRAAGVAALLTDCREVDRSPALAELERALRQSAHIFERDESDWSSDDLLSSQILGRLQQPPRPELKRLCQQATESIRQRGGLRPLTASLQASEALLSTFEGHESVVTALCVLADGRLASASHDLTIMLWNLQLHQCDAIFDNHTSVIACLTQLPDGRVAAGSDDGAIRLLDLQADSSPVALQGPPSAVLALALLADDILVSGADDGTIRRWNLSTHHCEFAFKAHTSAITALAVLPSGVIASASSDATIKLWDPDTWSCVLSCVGHERAVRGLAEWAACLVLGRRFDQTLVCGFIAVQRDVRRLRHGDNRTRSID
jgi:hypothetical protein